MTLNLQRHMITIPMPNVGMSELIIKAGYNPADYHVLIL